MDIADLHPTSDPLVMRGKGRNYYTKRPCENCGELSWMTKAARYCSRACMALVQSRERIGTGGPNWRGDDAGYNARHERVDAARGKASTHGCYNRQLGLRDCTSTWYEWSLIHGNDPLDPLSYVALCRMCHNRYDGSGAGKPRLDNQGSKHWGAKLTEDNVCEILSRPVSKGSIAAWAREFNVNYDVIRRVVNRKTWAWLEVG